MSALTRLRARASRTCLRAPLVWIRHLGLDGSDVFLASYPRSGNTMLRFILGEVLSGVPSSFETIQRIIPEVGVQAQACFLLQRAGRLIKTHEPYRRKYKRAIYIVRDVRDVMLSCFARESALDLLHINNLDSYVRPFMRGKMTRFGSWQRHVDGWMNSPLSRTGDLLVLRFEDMRSDLEGTVARCLDFLGKTADKAKINAAIRNNSLTRMREKEDKARTLPKSPKENGRWIGKGAIGGWRGTLTERQLEIVDEFAGDLLMRLNYPDSVGNRWPELKQSVLEEKLIESRRLKEGHETAIADS
jgi:Sulfotransferase domain